MHWRLNALVALHWQHWDGEWVVFDEGSGQTVAVDAVVAAALMALEGGCVSDAEIIGQVADDLQLSVTAALHEPVTQGLQFLAQLGLVDTVTA